MYGLSLIHIYKLYEEIEMPLVSVLADMEYEGVAIDKAALDEMCIRDRSMGI